MEHSLEQFASECHRILKEDPTPVGRGKVRDLVQVMLKDEMFLAIYLNDKTPDRQVLYEDPELGFCICAHMGRNANEAKPHDHGPTWAIYGQAIGETEMTDWEVIQRAAENHPGKVRRARVYALKQGMAHLYHEGDVHSPKRAATTGLIRIEGKNTRKIKRFPYEAV